MQLYIKAKVLQVKSKHSKFETKASNVFISIWNAQNKVTYRALNNYKYNYNLHRVKSNKIISKMDQCSSYQLTLFNPNIKPQNAHFLDFLRWSIYLEGTSFAIGCDLFFPFSACGGSIACSYWLGHCTFEGVNPIAYEMVLT